nr:SON DNA and RNA binding protein [Rousettus aegyptiacus]
MVLESTPVMLESSVIKGMNLLSGDQNLAPEIGTQEIPLHSDEEPHTEGHLKNDTYESEHGVNIDHNVNNHLIAKEMEHSTVFAASIGAVGEIGEEKSLPVSETQQCTVLDTCPSVGEADVGGTLSFTGPLALESDTVGTSKGIEFTTSSALSSISKYDDEICLTTQDTEHDMVISSSPSGGSEADIEGPLPAKDIHLDLPSSNFISNDAEGPLPIKESDQTLAVALSPKESSEDKEVPLSTKEILSDSGFSANIDDINEADLVRPLLPKDMERLTSLRAGIEGPLLASEVERDKSAASPVVVGIPERASESSSEEKDDYEIFVKVKDTHEKSKKNKNRDKGEKEKKRDSSLRSRSKRSKSSEHKSRKRTSESRSRARKRSSKSKSHRSQTRSRSRSRRRRRSSRSRSKSRGRRSVSKEKRKRSPKHRSKSRERKRKRSSSRDNRKTVRARSRTPSRRSRSHTPSRRRRSRSGGRRSFSISPSRRSRTPSRRSRTPSRRSRTPSRRSRTPSRRSRTPSRRSRTPSRRRRSRSVVRRRSFSISPVRLRRSRTPLRRRFSRSPLRRKRSRSSERGRSPKRLTDLNKAQLLEIAKANAAAMCAKAGVPLPPNLKPAPPPSIEEKVAKKSGGATIEELTEKCKQIAQSKEDDDVIVNKPHVSDEEEEEPPFYHHPFKLSEPKPIFFNLNIAAAKPTPPKSQVTLTKEFPVSSGSQHRKKEADSVYGEWVPVEKNGEENKDDDNVFSSNLPSEPVDISTAMSERALAQKRLSENAFDLEAMSMLNRAQERIDAWAQLNSIPGQFTGSTGVQVLTQEQLANTGAQAWIKKDQFLRAAPVTGGMGAVLMRKMGWREGEGLGKNKEGNKEPILVDFKTDRKGLVAVGERAQKRSGNFSAAMKDLSGKHPVSALMEICNKRRWQPPEFLLVHDSGPDHRKHFLFRVLINGSAYQPSFASPNKKHAKATAATVVLQAMGLVPKDLMANATCFRSASRR